MSTRNLELKETIFGTEMCSRTRRLLITKCPRIKTRIKTRKSERNHLHHRDMSKSVKYNTTSQWSQHTRLLSTKCPIWKNKWISGMIRDWNEHQKPNQNQKLKETICIIEICPNQWSTTLLPNDPIIHVSQSVHLNYNTNSPMIRDWNEHQKPNQNQKLKETICIIEICPIQWITTLLPNDPIIHVS